MSSPYMDDTYYRIDILEKVLIEEMVFLKPLEDPLEACLVGASQGEDVGLLGDKRDIYAKILNSALTFRGKHEEGLLMES